VSIYGVTACLTVDVQKTGREREAVRVERQRRVRGLEEDINVVHVESSQLQRSTQRLSTRTHNHTRTHTHTRTVKAKFITLSRLQTWSATWSQTCSELEFGLSRTT